MARAWVCCTERLAARRSPTVNTMIASRTASDMRTDAQLAQDLIAELSLKPLFNAERTGVEVKDEIALDGYIDNESEKRSTKRGAQCIPGVEAIDIGMDVERTGSMHNDDEIAHSIESALKWHTYATSDAIEIVVQGGQVTLSGELEWDWQSHGVVSTVRLLPGVVDVRDQIVVKSKAFENADKSDLDV